MPRWFSGAGSGRRQPPLPPSPMRLPQTSPQRVPLASEHFGCSPRWRCSLEASSEAQPRLSSGTEKWSSPGEKDIPVSGGRGDAGVGLVLVGDCWLWPRGQGHREETQ